MTVDATQPTDKTAAEIEAYIRENRVELNTLGSLIGAMSGSAWYDEIYDFTTGTLENGVDVQDVMFNIVRLGASGGPANLTDIIAETDGQVKLFLFEGANVTVIHNASYINLRGALDINFADGETLMLISAGGIWYEVQL